MSDILEPALKFSQGQGERRAHLAINRDLPAIRLSRHFRDLSIVADVMNLGRRDVVVEQVRRSLGHQRLVADYDEFGGFGWKIELRLLGERHRNIAFRHEASEW